MGFKEELHNTLLAELHNSRQKDLKELYEILIQFRDAGMDKDDMYQCLQNLRGACDGEAEDMVLELMDFVVGFVSPFSPYAMLYPAKPKITILGRQNFCKKLEKM